MPNTKRLDWRIVAVILASVILMGSSTVGGVKTIPADTPQLDAFGRARESAPVTIFDSAFQYSLQPLLWETILTGGASVSSTPNQSAVTMTVSAAGDSVVRQTHQYFRYTPGKSQLITMTGLMGPIKANTRQRVGYFDSANGMFFEQDGTNRRVVIRSSTSGAPVDNAVSQANWNVDKMDGSGPSRVVLDTSKVQLFLVDFQWLGTGRVRMGFNIDGQIVYAHQFLTANQQPAIYMTTANLPLRYELSMSGAATATTMLQNCQAVIAEGIPETDRGYIFTSNNGTTPISVSTTRRPVLSIRPKLTFNSIVNRALVEPLKAQAVVSSGSVLVEIVYNGTLTGAAFSSVDANSITERDVAATAISGGTVLASFYASGAGDTARGINSQDLEPLSSRIFALTLNAAGTVPDTLTVVATAFTGSVSLNSALAWKEVY